MTISGTRIEPIILPYTLTRPLRGERAGLEIYQDIALLIVLGRPLPEDDDLGQLTSTHLGHVPVGGYYQVRKGLLMQDGSRRANSVIEHEDPMESCSVRLSATTESSKPWVAGAA